MLSTPVLLGITALLYILKKKLSPIVRRRFFSPLRHLPGPPSAHWLLGNFKLLAKFESAVLQERWMEQYGSTMAYAGLLGTYQLWTMDLRALKHITTQSTIYQKPALSRYHISRIIGPGILVAEGTSLLASLSMSEDSYRNGIVRDSIEVAEGDMLIIPIKATNRYKPIWGDDAHEFRPERWENPPAIVSQMPGVWGHQLTFGGGQHSCIGCRFSLVETKALLFTLIRAFEFELAVPVDQVAKKSALVERPVVLGSTQLPLIVKPYIRL